LTAGSGDDATNVILLGSIPSHGTMEKQFYEVKVREVSIHYVTVAHESEQEASDLALDIVRKELVDYVFEGGYEAENVAVNSEVLVGDGYWADSNKGPRFKIAGEI
jgi:hypothetical protein